MKVKIGDKLPDAKVFIFETSPKEVSIKKIIAGGKTILFGDRWWGPSVVT